MSLFAELKRRNVIRVAIAYVVLSWLILQMGDLLFDLMGLPDWALRIVLGILVLGFVPALIFSWVYELTPEGVRKESELDRSQSVTPRTGRRLDITIAAMLTVAIAVFVADRTGLLGSAGESGPGIMAGKGAAADREGTPSLAVLAFQNMSADADNAYFADGISEEILNLLADFDELSVASRTSAFAFKDQNTPIPEIASILKVRYVLEGSVRKAGDQVRITAQLIDAHSDRHLWSETYDRTLDDIFAIQDEIALAIGDALKIEILGNQKQDTRAEAIDAESYASFLEARHLLRSRKDANIRRAIEILKQVVVDAPEFAPGHTVLGEAYFVSSEIDTDQAIALAERHANIAKKLDPDLGGVELILGNIAGYNDDRVGEMEHYTRAIELEPEEPRAYHWRGILFCEAGYFDRGRRDLERGVELEPLNPNIRFALAGCLRSLGEFEGARSAIEYAVTLSRRAGLTVLAGLHAEQGDWNTALEVLQRNVELKEDQPARWGAMKEVFEAAQASRDVTPLFAQGEPLEDDYYLLVWLGAFDTYLEALKTLPELQPSVLTPAWGVGSAELRRDVRFIEIMTRPGYTELWREMGPPPDCRAEGDSFTCGYGHGAVDP